MRGAVRVAAAVALVLTPVLPGSAPAEAAAESAAQPAAEPYGIGPGIPLPQTFRNIDPIHCLAIPGVRKDRCRTSKVPSTVDDTEALTVGLGPNGVPVVVTDRQHLVVHGSGPYLIYELGPARMAQGLNDFSLPTAKLGQVVWQGFSPGVRTLDGLLTLDASFEANRLPMSIRVGFIDDHGKHAALRPGGVAPADGAATITLTNLSPSKRFLSVGTAEVGPLARALDALLAAANSSQPGVPPYAGNSLPARIAGTLAGRTEALVTAPLRVRGSVTVPGAAGSPVTGPGTTPLPGGASISGTLNETPVSFEAKLRAGQQLALSLDVQPWIDARTFPPPGNARSWSAWAATHPPASAVSNATAMLMSTAAQAARAADYSPYLQTDTHGRAAASFHYEMASASATQRAGEALAAKPGAIIAACLAGLAIAGNAALLRRQW